jgi:hypothetical protein
MAGGHLAYMRRLGAPIENVPALELWIGGGIAGGSADGTLFQTITTGISSFTMYGMARARYRLMRYVRASARAAVGGSRASVDLTDQAGQKVSDSGWSALASGALGVEVTSREDRRATIGLRLELGYTRVTGASVAPVADVPDNTIRLKMSQASIGHLDLSGPFLSFSLISSF